MKSKTEPVRKILPANVVQPSSSPSLRGRGERLRQENRSRIPRAVSRGALWLLRNWILALALIFIFMWTFMPILWAFSMSFTSATEIYTMPRRFLPREPTLDNYRWVFEYMPDLLLYFKNSIVITLGTIAVRTFCAALMGYACARLDFRGRDLIFYSLIAALFVPRTGGLMAQYELMDALHLRNSLFGLVLLFASDLSVPILIMRQSFFGMPGELEDAARIDGAGRCHLFFKIAIPCATGGMLAVAALTYADVWGDYLTTLTMIDNQNLYTVGVGSAIVSDILRVCFI